MDGEALAEAIRGAQRGDSASFDRLADAFASRIFGFLFRLTCSKHDAEDLMQEVFVRVVRTIGAYRHEDRFEAWIFRIATNLVRDRIRRARRAPKQITTADSAGSDDEGGHRVLEGIVGPSEGAHARLVLGEEIDAMNTALARLPEAEREVIMLRHFSEMSFKEIAEAMGTPLGTALARAHRGLARLREILGAPRGAAAPHDRVGSLSTKG